MAKKNEARKAVKPTSASSGIFIKPSSIQNAMDTQQHIGQTPLTVQMTSWILMAFVLMIVLAMTPLTHNLDDIKILLFFWFGPVSMLLGLGCFALKQVPIPNRFITGGLVAYIVVFIISILTAYYKVPEGVKLSGPVSLSWITGYQWLFLWSALGFFVSGICAGAYKTTAWAMIRFFTALLVIVTLIGYFMYGLLPEGDNRSIVAWLFNHLYPVAQRTPEQQQGAWFQLWNTLATADNVIQSTILNRDFFAAFCCLLLPCSMLLACEPGPGNFTKRIIWRVLGGLGAILSISGIFLAQSKGELVGGVFEVIMFCALFFMVGELTKGQKKLVIYGLIATMLIIGVLAWMKSPIMLSQLKAFSYSFESRNVIFSGSLGVFMRYPILGAGPGGFRMNFPEFRRNDYFNHEISNLTLFSHNYLLDVLSETGILGFIAFMVFICALGILALRCVLKNKNRDLRLQSLALITGLIAFLFSNLTSPNARWVIGATPLWPTLGLLAGILSRADGWTPEQSQTTLKSKFPLLQFFSEQRVFVYSTLFVAAFTMLFFCSQKGYRYFESAKTYIKGVSQLEYVYRLLSEQNNNMKPDQYIFLLDQANDFLEKSIADDPGVNQTTISAYYKVASGYMTLAQLYDSMANDMRRQNRLEEAKAFQARSDKALTDARDRYEKLEQYFPDYAEIHFNFGIIYKRYAEYLERLAQEFPNASIFRDVPAADQIKDYTERSLAHLDRMGKMSIKEEVIDQQGGQYLSMEYYPKARDIFMKAIEIYPNNVNFARNAYHAAANSEDWDSAATALNMLVTQTPGDEDLYNRMFLLGVDQGSTHSLQLLAKRLEHVNPLHPLLFETLAKLNAKNPKQLVQIANDYAAIHGRSPDVYQAGLDAALALGDTTGTQTIARYVETMHVDPASTLSQTVRRVLGQ